MTPRQSLQSRARLHRHGDFHELPAALLALLLAGCGASGPGSDPAGPGRPLGSAAVSPPAPPVPGAAASVGGCQIFPNDNAWNRDVSADPVAANSAALLGVMSPGNALHLDLGTTEEYYGIPYTVVPADQPLVTIEYGTDGADYGDESDPGPMPIPPNAPIEGGSTADPNPGAGDRHVLVVRQGECVLYELYNAVRTAGGFRVSSSARWDLTVERDAPGGVDLGRRGRPPDPARAAALRRGGRRRDQARAPFHRPARAARLRGAGEPLRPVRRRQPCPRTARGRGSRPISPSHRIPATRWCC